MTPGMNWPAALCLLPVMVMGALFVGAVIGALTHGDIDDD